MKKQILSVIVTSIVMLHCHAQRNVGNGTPQPNLFTAAIISADKMNMLYIGLDNPVSVSVPGYRPDQVLVSISGGGTLVSRTPGHFTIKPDGSVREITLKAIIVLDDSSKKQVGQQVYRIRKIPHPEVLFGTKNGGRISRGEVATVSQINCGLGEGFAFEGLRFTVNSYTLIIAKEKGETYIENIMGNKISEASRAALQNLSAGDYIIVTNIEAEGPAGKVLLSGVTLQVK